MKETPFYVLFEVVLLLTCIITACVYLSDYYGHRKDNPPKIDSDGRSKRKAYPRHSPYAKGFGLIFAAFVLGGWFFAKHFQEFLALSIVTGLVCGGFLLYSLVKWGNSPGRMNT